MSHDWPGIDKWILLFAKKFSDLFPRVCCNRQNSTLLQSYSNYKNENGCTKVAGKEKPGIECVVNCIGG